MSVSKFDYFSDKFTPANLPEVCAARSELLSVFSAAAASRLVFVSAPAGFGKTVSTLLWLRSAKRRAVWIGLDEYDNSTFIFYKTLCMSILSVQPDNTRMRNILRSDSFSSSPVEHTINLLTEFFVTPSIGQLALVLDDMHLITNEEIIKSLPFVLKRLPGSFITLILSRGAPAGRFDAMLDAGKAALIGSDDLAFSEKEILVYCSAHGWSMTAEEAAAAFRVTGGWAIGVNAIAKSRKLDIDKDSGRTLSNYIKNQIWDIWDEDLRIFMLNTSVVDEMTAELCASLTGREDSREILDKLCAENSFVSHFGGDIYRYHSLFLVFLRSIREHYDGIDLPALYSIVAEYCLKLGDNLDARRYSLKSGNFDLIVRSNYALMQNDGIGVSLYEYVNYYRSIINEDLSPELCEKFPVAYSTLAWYHFLTGNAQKTEHYLDKLYESLPIISEHFPQFLEASLLISAIDTRVSFSTLIESFGALPHVERSNSKLQAVSISMHLPYAHRTLREYMELADNNVLEELAQSYGTLLKDQYEYILLVFFSGMLFERNQLPDALEIVLQTKKEIRHSTNSEVVFCNFAHLTSIYYEMGNEQQLSKAMAQTEEFLETSGAGHLRQNYLALKAKFLILDGSIAAASGWLENYFVNEQENLELLRVFQHFTTARAHILLGDFARAEKLILGLKKLGSDFRRPLDVAEAGVLLAVLEWVSGRRKEAETTLVSALTDLQRYGFIHIVSSEGNAVLPILKKIMRRAEKGEFSGQLDKKYLNEVFLAAYTQAKIRKGITADISNQPAKLSKQQKKMIELLSQGYKNPDIVKITGLSLNTVKAHNRLAYEKLNVSNAADAVLRARELGIIG